MRRICQNCKREISETASWCEHCGSKIETITKSESYAICPGCKNQISDQIDICNNCGCKISKEEQKQVQELVDKFYMKNNYTVYLERLQELADDGSAAANCELGFSYYDGDPKLKISANMTKAIEYFEKAAARNFTKAEFQLGYIQDNEYKNGKKAIYWYERAIEHGGEAAEIALNNIGVLYLTGGCGVEQNTRLAIEYYRKSADAGYSIAAENLGWIYYNGKYVQKNNELSKKYFELAVLLGSKTAQNNINEIFGKATNYYTNPQITNVIRCPNCHSENVHKISAISKGASALMWGIFSLNKLASSYECDNCKYRW